MAIWSFLVHLGVFAVKYIIKQIRSDAYNIVTLVIIPTTNISTNQKPLINCQLIVNKSADIVDIFRDVEFENHRWCSERGLYSPTSISNAQKSWGVGILVRDSLKFKQHPCFKSSSLNIISLLSHHGSKHP